MLKLIGTTIIMLASSTVFAENAYAKEHGISKIIAARVVYPHFQQSAIINDATSVEDITVVVASTKELKINATKSFFTQHLSFKNKKITYFGVKAASNIAEQPLGLKSATLGAANRIKDAKFLAAQQIIKITGPIYYVAIENFFTELQENIKPSDHALVIIEEPNGQQHCYLSEGVEISEEIYGQVVTYKNRAPDHTGVNSTIGEYLAQKYSVEAPDWFGLVTDSTYKRQQQISSAFKFG